ncbi:MAG: hypothetical protein ACI8TP_003403 [Acidimicrobiales bacterium]|jgi:hypothetical protein
MWSAGSALAIRNGSSPSRPQKVMWVIPSRSHASRIDIRKAVKNIARNKEAFIARQKTELFESGPQHRFREMHVRDENDLESTCRSRSSAATDPGTATAKKRSTLSSKAPHRAPFVSARAGWSLPTLDPFVAKTTASNVATPQILIDVEGPRPRIDQRGPVAVARHLFSSSANRDPFLPQMNWSAPSIPPRYLWPDPNQYSAEAEVL